MIAFRHQRSNVVMRFSIVAVLVGLSFGCQVASAQWGAISASPQTMALAYSNIALAWDASNINPALFTDTSDSHSLDFRPSKRIHASFSPLPNGLESSWSAAANGEYQLSSQQMLGASFGHTSYSNIYSSDALSLQYSETFSIDSERRAVAGVRLHYDEENFDGPYLPFEDLSLDAGLSVSLAKTLQLGAAVTHLISLFHNQDRSIDTLTSWFGLSYEPIPEATLHAAVESREGESVGLRFGAEYIVERYLKLRFGVATATSEYTGGIGITSGELALDFSLLHHPELGSTLAFGISYAL